MNPVWTKLPIDLTEHICNQLPKVRKIPDTLKLQIEAYGRYRNKCEKLECLFSDNPYYGMGIGEYDEHLKIQRLQAEISMIWNYIHPDQKSVFSTRTEDQSPV